MIFRRFAKDRSGNVAILCAILLPVLVGGAGFAVDYAYYTLVKGELQGAADAAATAGAVSLPLVTEATRAALELAHKNVPSTVGTVAEAGDVEIGIYNAVDRSFTVSSLLPNAVRVTTGRTVARGNAPRAMFSAIWGHEHLEIHAVAIAVAIQSRYHCLHALNGTVDNAFHMTGESVLSLPTCGVQVNSNSATAARTEGAATVTSEVFNLTGGSVGVGFNPVPTTRAPQPDPYAHVPEPAVPPACTYTNHSFELSTYFPAGTRFCGVTNFKNGIFTFAPGVHYFTGSSVVFETKDGVIANNVMFYFGPDVDVRIAAKGYFQMTAMVSGPYAGIAIFQSRNSSTVPTMLIEGGAVLNIDAMIYTPKTKLEMAGKSGMVIGTGIVIADTVKYRGGATFSVALRNSLLPPPTQSALVQ